MNRLQHETSPYLLQHAGNPVDWYPWGDEAFGRARREDRPILLSIGYSACHWCHVMAHESFEHEPTARLMNSLFVNIKVDREERPDLDDIYMQAVQALSGHGGWPMTVFLTPDGRPFYGGTYFPPEPRHNIPAFRQVLTGVAQTYTQRRQQVEDAAASLTEALNRELLGIGGEPSSLNAALLDHAYQHIGQGFDSIRGGFGPAPKFPQPMNLEFLLRSHARTGDPAPLQQVTFTLRQMARGGIYDQIGAGFHRYSTDPIWLVPHFEKMLYDNAQLSRVYLHTWQITGDPFFKTIATEVYDYILREMTSPDGAFYSATDADSEGEEGRFFVWTRDELQSILGEDAAVAVEYWGVTGRGNFEGSSILYVPADDEEVASRLNLSAEDLRARIARIRDRLYAHRSQRAAPALDDKILTSWNGMMLASLSEAARVLDREDYRLAAIRNATFLLGVMTGPDGRLFRSHRHGLSKNAGVLEDYAALVDGLLELYQTTFDPRWFIEARRLADEVMERFPASEGGFFDTAFDHEPLIVRPRSLQDNAIPSGNALMARGLIRLTAYTGDSRYEAAARGVLVLLSEALRQHPPAFGEFLNALDMLVRGLDEIAIIGEPGPVTSALLDVIQKPYRPSIITALSNADVFAESSVPLLAHRSAPDGQPTVYICRQFACANPVTTPQEVNALLA